MTLANINVTNSRFKLISNIIISFVGAGMLGLPFAFKEGGVFGGIVILCLIAIISTVSMLMVVDCKYVTAKIKFGSKRSNGDIKSLKISVPYQKLGGDDPDMSFDLIQYSDIGYEAMGKFGRVTVDLMIVLSQIGFCCAYLIFISENVTNYFPYIQKWQCVFTSATVVIGLTLFRNLGSLGYFSFIAQCTQLVAFITVLWFDFYHIRNASASINYFSMSGFPFLFAFSSYCYEGAGMILALESSSSLSIRSNFKKYLIIIIIFITCCYIFFGLAGYLSFGDNTYSVITLNLADNKSQFMTRFAVAVKICLCLSLLLTYPVMMFPVSQLLDKKFKLNEKVWLGNLLRLTLVSVTIVVVMVVQKFEVLMGFIGATCCTSLAFILPGIFHFRLMKKSKCCFIFDVFLVLFGICIMIFGIMDAINRAMSI